MGGRVAPTAGLAPAHHWLRCYSNPELSAPVTCLWRTGGLGPHRQNMPHSRILPALLLRISAWIPLYFRTMAAHFRLGPFPGRMPAGAQGVVSLQQLSTPTFVWSLSSLETGRLPAF